jgi:hypothetical protein
MKIKFPAAAALYVCWSYAICLYAQNAPKDPVKDLLKLYPDNECIAKTETKRYVFTVTESKGKVKEPVLTITEKYNGEFITGSDYYRKVTSVFYDDYSKVDKVKCKANGRLLPELALINTNYQSEDIFHDDVKVCAFPVEMNKGSSYTIEYEKQMYNPRVFSKVYFHSGNPSNKKTIVFEVPEGVEIELKEFNFAGYNIKKKENKVPAKKITEIIFEAERLESIPSENNSPSQAKYLPHLLIFVKSYGNKKKTAKVFETHKDIYGWCKNLVDSVDNKGEELTTLAKDLAAGETDSVKIMEKVFYWVQDHVRYIAFEDGIMGYKPMEAKKVYTQLYGDCKGMANFTKTILKSLGFDARLTWIGTSDIPYNNDLPTLAVYNHMICCVILGGKKYFLDATEDWIALDDYAERIQGRPVMVENGSSYLQEIIPQFTHERNKNFCKTEFNISGDVLKGDCSYEFTGEGKTTFLRQIAGIKTENKYNAIRNYLRSGNQNLTVKNYTTSDLNNRRQPISLKAEMEVKNACYKLSNNELLLLPEKDFDFEQLQLDSTRKTDYQFRTKYFLVYSNKVNLPPNSKVKSLPEPVNISNDYYEFKMSYKVENGSVTEEKTLIVKKPLLEKKNFNQWNEDIRLVRKFYRTPVIVTL